MQAILYTASGVGLAMAGVAALFDRRDRNRADLDRVSLVSWPLVMVLALLVAVTCAGLAIRIPD